MFASCILNYETTLYECGGAGAHGDYYGTNYLRPTRMPAGLSTYA
jgi:hypothetical protein